MNKKALALRREYQREWRRKNPDKVRAAQDRYWNKKAAEAEANDRPGDTTPAAAGE